MFHPLVRREARRAAARAASSRYNVTLFTARRMLRKVTDEQIDGVVEAEAVRAGVALPEGREGRGEGEGTILERIKAFCDAHPELMKVIVTVLLAFVGL